MMPSLASSSSSSASCSSICLFSMPTLPSILRLPSALLSHICSYLSTEQLLVTLARTAKSTRDVLTPACFSYHELAFYSRRLSRLPSLALSSSSVAVPSFYGRALSACRLCIGVASSSRSRRRAFDSLSHFPACRSLSLQGNGWQQQLTDDELHALLHQPAVLSCDELSLDGFTRYSTDEDSVVGTAMQGPMTRSRRKRSNSQRKPFDWADISLPRLTRLHLRLHGTVPYTGVSAFLTAHTRLVELDINTQLVSVDELAALFRDSAALPHLSRFSFREFQPQPGAAAGQDTCLTALTALGSVVMAASGRPRPMQQLEVDVLPERGVFAVAALMPGLTRLHVSGARAGWLEEWEAEEMSAALPLLQELSVYRRHEQVAIAADRPPLAARDVRPFLQCMASRPLQKLHIQTGEPLSFHANALAELARCQQLRELHLSTGLYAEPSGWMDWRDATLLASFAAGTFTHLRSLELNNVKLSAESVVAIASAAPQLLELRMSLVELSCHPAVVCAIVGGCCERIEMIYLEDQQYHAWRDVRAADLVDGYQAAVAAAGRGDGYRPFTRLVRLEVTMCWCTPPSVWHALLSLLKWADLQCACNVASNDPLVVSALSYLPSLDALSHSCLWPRSFATFLEQKSEQEGEYRYLTATDLKGTMCLGGPDQRTDLELSDYSGDVQLERALRLRPRSNLFAAFQLSLSAEQQAAVERWSRGDFQAGDEQLSAAETPLVRDEEEEAAVPEGRQLCPYPQFFHTRRLANRSEAGRASEEEEDDEEERWMSAELEETEEKNH